MSLHLEPFTQNSESWVIFTKIWKVSKWLIWAQVNVIIKSEYKWEMNSILLRIVFGTYLVFCILSYCV